MTDAEERAYMEGRRSVWSQLLGQCLEGLGYNGPEWNQHRWALERDAAVSQLRNVCSYHGDNDWEDDLHLADVIQKHLGNHLDDRDMEAREEYPDGS